MLPNEDAENAWKDGFALGYDEQNYSRNWENPYTTMKARWAMVRGYEAAWAAKRQADELRQHPESPQKLCTCCPGNCVYQ